MGIVVTQSGSFANDPPTCSLSRDKPTKTKATKSLLDGRYSTRPSVASMHCSSLQCYAATNSRLMLDRCPYWAARPRPA